MTHHIFLNNLSWRPVLLAVALSLTTPALADVPPATGAIGSAKTQADRLVADAQKALRAGNGRLALITVKNALTADPHNVAGRVLLGSLLYQAGDTGAAERELRQARKDGAQPSLVLPPLFDVMLVRGEAQLLLNQFPDPGPNANAPGAADTLLARAMAFQSLKKTAEAVDAIDRSIALRRDARGLLIRARIASMQGQDADARKFADEAITKANTPDAMLFKIGLLLAANQVQAALDASNQLLAKYPGNLQGRFARVEAYMALKQDDNAKAEIDDILAKMPSTLMGTYYRALLLARSGKSKEAWNLAQNLPGEFRDSQPRISLMMAEMAGGAGNAETSASILGRLLLKEPAMTLPRIRLAAIRLRQNNPSDALAVLNPVKDSPDPRVQEMLANVYIRLGRNDDALNILHKLNADGKAGPDVRRSIAVLEIRAGRLDQGIRDLTQLASKDPANAEIAAPLITALAQAKRFPEALAAADRLGRDPKQRIPALIYRGDILASQRDNAGAQAAFDKAVAADSKSIPALFARAQFFAAIQKYADANRDLQAILAMEPKNLGALLKLTDIAMLQGQDRNVRSLLVQAVAAAPQASAPRLALTRYLIAKKDFKGALPVATDFAKSQPNNADAVTLLGNVQLALGQKQEAVASYRRLVSLMPTSAVAQVLLGDALATSGDRAGSTRAMEVAVKLAPTSPDIRAAQIKTLLHQGNNDGAVATARAFQSSTPGTGSDLLLAETLDRTKQHDQAVSVLNKSLAERPSNVVLLRLAHYALQAKDIGRAADIMSKWLTNHSDDIAVRLEYAGLLMQQEDNARAISQYELALKQDPNNVLALNNLGWLIQANDTKRALALLSQAAKLAPNSPDVADTLGWLKLKQKDAASSLDLLNKAHTLRPEDGQITYHLVVALDANAKRDAARSLLKTLLASNVQFKDRPAATQLASSWH